jgi:hypothetical protein
MLAQFDDELQRYVSPPVPPVPPPATPPTPPAPIFIATIVLGVNVMFVTFEYAPPPPPTPDLYDAILPEPPPPAPMTSTELLVELQSDGTVHDVPDVRYTVCDVSISVVIDGTYEITTIPWAPEAPEPLGWNEPPPPPAP